MDPHYNVRLRKKSVLHEEFSHFLFAIGTVLCCLISDELRCHKMLPLLLLWIDFIFAG